MARHGISRPQGDVARAPAVPHDVWRKGLHSGALTLRLETLSNRFVSPGTGRLVLSGPAGREEVAERAAHSHDRPVLPGSGIKGAVRTLYELLSFSCNPFDFRAGCKPPRRGEDWSLCDACSLFGARGYLGRISFSDGVPGAAGAVHVAVRQLPIGHEADREKTPGDFRVYDLAADSPGGPGGRPRETRAREVFTGIFRCRLDFANVSEVEIGRLLVCLGLGGDGFQGFPLRLGGVKYDGHGAVRVAAEELILRSPKTERLTDGAREQRVAVWLAAARGSSSWYATFQSVYQQLAATLSTGEAAR